MVGDMQAFAHIIAVKSDIQFAVLHQLGRNNGSQFLHDPVAEENPSWLQANNDRIGQLEIVLQDLVCQSFNG